MFFCPPLAWFSIRDGEEASVSRAQERMKRLEQEIHDLRRRNTELEKLSLTDHHLHFLQSFQSLSDDAPGSSGSSSGALASPLTFDQFHEFVPHWRKEMDLISARDLHGASNPQLLSTIFSRTSRGTDGLRNQQENIELLNSLPSTEL
ncbi:hypothetical protein DNTS_032694 [Danionella cerebrum]|uniref:TRIM8/14/16/25/29/45/65 coiled-coil region domain-containing protein n=1 Tax=Danionella cerebrum TaxID=2873325 RepID=A0A553MPY3_9TELE|nr:hypothetical protein DNTS_032694 [Danionella translucida]